MEVPLTVRDLQPDDLADLDWSGGPQHLAVVAGDLAAAAAGEVVQLVVALPTGRLVGMGAADLRRSPESGTVWMLAVHELLQGLGVGTLLVGALERRILEAGRWRARISVEHDNPRAAALYRRLGYVEVGSELTSWPAAHGETYVTVCSVLERRLG